MLQAPTVEATSQYPSPIHCLFEIEPGHRDPRLNVIHSQPVGTCATMIAREGAPCARSAACQSTQQPSSAPTDLSARSAPTPSQPTPANADGTRAPGYEGRGAGGRHERGESAGSPAILGAVGREGRSGDSESPSDRTAHFFSRPIPSGPCHCNAKRLPMQSHAHALPGRGPGRGVSLTPRPGR